MTEGGCEVWFYHLERTSLDAALPELLEKTLARSWRALVRSTEPERVDHLDGWLWTYRDDSFLPHGVDGEPMSERQPVLITTSMANPNQADVLFLIDGAELRATSRPIQRCILLFDGRDEAALGLAATALERVQGRWLRGVLLAAGRNERMAQRGLRAALVAMLALAACGTPAPKPPPPAAAPVAPPPAPPPPESKAVAPARRGIAAPPRRPVRLRAHSSIWSESRAPTFPSRSTQTAAAWSAPPAWSPRTTAPIARPSPTTPRPGW